MPILTAIYPIPPTRVLVNDINAINQVLWKLEKTIFQHF